MVTLQRREKFETLYEKEDPWKTRSQERDRVKKCVEIVSSLEIKGALSDCGCGEGVITSLLRKHFADIVGIDISKKALQRAKRTVGLDFVQGDIQHMPFRNRSLSCITCFETLYYLKEEGCWKTALQEFYRTLKSNAYCVISIQSGKEYLDQNALLNFVTKKFEITHFSVFSKCIPAHLPKILVTHTSRFLANKLKYKILIILKKKA